MNHLIADPDFPLFVVVGVLLLIVALVGRLGQRRMLRDANAKAREQLELRVAGFTGALAQMESQIADLARMVTNLREALALSSGPPAHINGAAATPPAKPSEEVPPEVLVVIAAAVTSFLGKKVRVRSAKMLQSPYEIVNPWAQQGRATIQASHALRSWGHPDGLRGRTMRPGARS
jgi:hypothetical protein